MCPSHLIVRPAFEIPYSARPASAVEVAIDSRNERIRQTTKKSATPVPTIAFIVVT